VHFPRSGSTSHPGKTVQTNCNQPSSVSSIRWETLSFAADGSPELDVSDGWFDGHSCSILPVRRTVLHPKVVVRVAGAPVVLAMQGGSPVTFLLPPERALACDAPPERANVTRGVLTAISLPVARGGAVTASASLAGATLKSFLGEPSPEAESPALPAELLV